MRRTGERDGDKKTKKKHSTDDGIHKSDMEFRMIY
jgi:hypothetical protein